jgi:hypothetical protein
MPESQPNADAVYDADREEDCTRDEDAPPILTCPTCGRQGTVIYEEAESPPHRGPTGESYQSDLVGASAPFMIERATGRIIVHCECGQEIS